MKIIKESFGVVDKFTGDGVLSFFPEFFSGADAGYLVVTAATRCHEAFAHHYRSFRSSFNSVLSDVGLGIGIDFGMLHLVQIAGGLTVVGQPVVYACRMGSCPAGMTLLNQPAYEKIMEKFSGHVFVQETELEIKHEGKTLAYHVSLNRHQYQPQVPDWVGSASAPGA
jgi:class 3 adenylate cyclase